jgi:hypothetical protein
MSDNLIRDLKEWCPSEGADAWPIMRQAANRIEKLQRALRFYSDDSLFGNVAREALGDQ